MITLTLATNLSIDSTIARLSIEKIAKAMIPFMIGLVVALFIFYDVPILIPGLF